MKITLRTRLSLMAVAFGGLVLGCSSCGDDETNVRADVVSSYAELVEASYKESLDAAKVLNNAIKAFTANPSEAAFTEAKEAWLASREPYLQTEVYRFYEGPIDNETDGPEGLLNAWPMDEHFVDYTEGKPDAGLINDTSFAITAENIEGKNEEDGEKNIATGYHAIEFLLWGEDTTEEAGAGQRPYTDYVTGDNGTAKNQDRRAKYLEVTGDLLVSHLEQVHSQWTTDGAYRKAFVADEADKSLEKILTGMIVLAGFETGGERLQAALDSGSREDEHSCFSDNTHRDMVQDVQGISNVFYGTYTFQDSTSWSGKGIKSVIEELDADLATTLGAEIDAALASAKSLQVPFDMEIKPNNAAGRMRVEDLITKLFKVEATLRSVFNQMKFTVPADAVPAE